VVEIDIHYAYTYVDEIHQNYMQNMSINSPKQAKVREHEEGVSRMTPLA